MGVYNEIEVSDGEEAVRILEERLGFDEVCVRVVHRLGLAPLVCPSCCASAFARPLSLCLCLAFCLYVCLCLSVSVSVSLSLRFFRANVYFAVGGLGRTGRRNSSGLRDSCMTLQYVVFMSGRKMHGRHRQKLSAYSCEGVIGDSACRPRKAGLRSAERRRH